MPQTPTIDAYLADSPISSELAQLAEPHAELIETALCALNRLNLPDDALHTLIFSIYDNARDLANDPLFDDLAYPTTFPSIPPQLP